MYIVTLTSKCEGRTELGEGYQYTYYHHKFDNFTEASDKYEILTELDDTHEVSLCEIIETKN